MVTDDLGAREGLGREELGIKTGKTQDNKSLFSLTDDAAGLRRGGARTQETADEQTQRSSVLFLSCFTKRRDRSCFPYGGITKQPQARWLSFILKGNGPENTLPTYIQLDKHTVNHHKRRL